MASALPLTTLSTLTLIFFSTIGPTTSSRFFTKPRTFEVDGLCIGSRPSSKFEFCCAGKMYFDPNFLYSCCNGRVCDISPYMTTRPPTTIPPGETTPADGYTPVVLLFSRTWRIPSTTTTSPPPPTPQMTTTTTTEPTTTTTETTTEPTTTTTETTTEPTTMTTETTTEAWTNTPPHTTPAPLTYMPYFIEKIQEQRSLLCGEIDMVKLKQLSAHLKCCGRTIYDSRFFDCSASVIVRGQGGVKGADEETTTPPTTTTTTRATLLPPLIDASLFYPAEMSAPYSSYYLNGNNGPSLLQTSNVQRDNYDTPVYPPQPSYNFVPSAPFPPPVPAHFSQHLPASYKSQFLSPPRLQLFNNNPAPIRYHPHHHQTKPQKQPTYQQNTPPLSKHVSDLLSPYASITCGKNSYYVATSYARHLKCCSDKIYDTRKSYCQLTPPTAPPAAETRPANSDSLFYQSIDRFQFDDKGDSPFGWRLH